MEIKSIRLSVKRVLLTGVLMGAAVVSLGGAAVAGEGCYRGYGCKPAPVYGSGYGSYVPRQPVYGGPFSGYIPRIPHHVSGYQSQGYVKSYSSGTVRSYRGGYGGAY